jgi:anti-sigma factor (TIGR02949 family)
MPDFSDQTSPGKSPSCLEMLQIILDGDATPEQHAQFQDHMIKCMPCYQTYNLEMAVKALLKSRCAGNGAPPDLIEKIKTQISQNLPH